MSLNLSPAELVDRFTALLAGHAGPAELQAALADLQPYDIATVLEQLEEPGALALVAAMDPHVAAETLEHLSYDDQYRLLDHGPEERARVIVAEMGTDAVVDLAGALHPRRALRLMGWLTDEEKEAVKRLLSYPEETAGGIMTDDFIYCRENWTAEQTLTHIRKVGRNAEIVLYIYVVDGQGRLVGITSLRALILADPKTRVREFMQSHVITVRADADQEQAARTLADYDLVALPVVATDGRLVGVITADDVLDVIEEEATEDIARMGGTEPLDIPYLRAGFGEMIRKRVGWLMILFVAQSVTSTILQHYEGVLAEVVALAFFIPLLIGTGGNAGAQAATLVIRALAVGEIKLSDFLRVVWREARLGLSLGAILAVAIFLRAMLLGGPMLIGLVVAATLMVVVVLSSMAGATLPLLGKWLGLDPAVISAPLITTFVDAAGLLLYFNMARWLLGLGG